VKTDSQGFGRWAMKMVVGQK